MSFSKSPPRLKGLFEAQLIIQSIQMPEMGNLDDSLPVWVLRDTFHIKHAFFLVGHVQVVLADDDSEAVGLFVAEIQ